MGAWQPRLDVLPAEQRRLWPLLAAVPATFTLYGGTGLALRLGHRPSVDFDFFTDTEFDPVALAGSNPLFASGFVEVTGTNSLGMLVSGVRLSLFGGIDIAVLEPPDLAENGVAVASLLDLAGTKAKALLDRVETKDYLDLDAILRAGTSLSDVLGAFALLFPQVSPMIVARSLGYLDQPELVELPGTVRRRLLDAINHTRTVTSFGPRYASITMARRATR